MTQRLPTIAYLLGAGGAIPFVACAVAAMSRNAIVVPALAGLTGYGAVILSFVGAVHWGFALAPGTTPPAHPSVATRLTLGIVPSLIGWCAALIAVAGLPDVGLALLIAGFVATVIVERNWAAQGLMPPGDMALRWGLTIVVIITLTTVLGLRLIGASIIL